MRKIAFPAFLSATLLLGGCAAGMGGDPLGGLLQGVLGGDNRGYSSGNDEFQRAAVNACGQEASRYGRVTIDNVRQESRNILRVEGRVENQQRRSFTCSFRSDGQIVDFRIA
jgi:hypothetical protein